MSDSTIPEAPSRKRRSPRSRRPIIRRRRSRRPLVTGADLALHALVVQCGDFIDVDGRQYLVSPVDDDLMETIAAALGAVEDMEPSIGPPDDRELDTCDDEDELGWLQDHGSERGRLTDGFSPEGQSEGDDDPDAEDDDPDSGIDDVPHDGDPDPDREPDLVGATDAGLQGALALAEGELYRLTERDAGYVAAARRRVRERPDDGGRYGARKLVLALMRRSRLR